MQKLGRDRPLVIGHRGAPGYRPEHTESAYRLAFAQGADAVEPDIVATRDGVLVVRHENEISGTTDVAHRPEFAMRRTTKTVDGLSVTGWFTEDFTWEELQTLRCRERLPRLRPHNTAYDGTEPMLRLCDVLRIADEAAEERGGPVGAIVEIKHAHYFSRLGYRLDDLLLAELEQTGWSVREGLVVESFETGVLGRLRAAGLRAPAVFLTETLGAPADEVGAVDRGESYTTHPYSWYRTSEGLATLVGRVDGVSVAKRDLLETDASGRAVGANDLVARAHDLGLTAYTWTFRPENRFLNRRFRSSGGPAELGDWEGEFGMILGSGVDGVFVDHPDLGRRAVDALTALRPRIPRPRRRDPSP